MILDHHRLLAASLTAVLFCLPSCSSPEAGAPDADPAAPIREETAATERADAEPGTQPGSDMQDPQGTVQEQRNAILVEQYLENAERLRRQGTETGLEAARLELLKAREIRPSDERIDRLLAVIGAELGLPAGTVESFADEQARLQKINEERQKSEVLTLLDSGNQALAQSNYARAVEDFRQAQLNIDIGRYIEWGDLEPRVREALANAERMRDEADRAQLEAVRRDVAAKRQASEQADAARRQARIDGLLSNAMLAFERRQFKLSQDLAYEAMEVDASNQVARELHNAAIKAARESRTDDYYRAMSRRIRTLREEAEELRVPQMDVLTVDSEIWDRAQRRSAAARTVYDVDPDDAALREQLDETKISGLSFTEEDGTFAEVKSRLQAITDVPIIITPEAQSTIDDGSLTLVMEVTAPISVANFLNRLVSLSEELAWGVNHGVVQITTTAQSGGENVTTYKDVRDLVFAQTEFLPPTIRDIPSGQDAGETPRTGGEGEDKTYFVELDTLIANIQEATDPAYWGGDSGAMIEQAEAGYLLVTANAEMQQRIDRVLNDLRRFASAVVTIESKFLTVSQNFLQEIGVDWRGLGGSGSKGTVAQLDNITNGLDDNASRGQDNSGTGDAAGNPSSGAFFDDEGDGDLRARTENYFTNPLGRSLSSSGGATAAVVFLNDLELQAIIRAVEKREDVQELNGQNLTVQNNQRGHVSIINQTAYVRDFEVEVAQAAFIADPQIDVIQDGIVLDVRPTVSHDRQPITLSMQPTVAELVRPIPIFSTSLAGTTQPVTVQLPQLLVRSFATTVTVPDGGSVLIGGLREVLTKERRAEVPVLGRIPLLGFFFKQEGVVDENTSLMVLVRATLTDVHDVMTKR